MSLRSSLIHMGNKGKPVWANSTENLLWHNFKKLFLTIIVRCQNPHSVPSCSLWGCVAATEQFESHADPCPLLKVLQWGHRHQNWTMQQWPVLINHFFTPWAIDGSRTHYRKDSYTTFFGKCFAEKLWVRALWMLLDTKHQPNILQSKHYWWQWTLSVG